MAPSEIAVWTNREPHDITTLVDRLQRDGFISTERSSKDRRRVNICLTDKGRKTVTETSSIAREIINQVMTSIDEDDALILEKLALTLRQNSNAGLAELQDVNKPS